MTTITDSVDADRALKAKHRSMWASGDYPTVAADVIPGLGAVLAEACGVQPGHRVLDVAAGAGNAAIPAALGGADVVACDLTPELLAAGRARAERLGARLEWREADAEQLPFGDGEFDVVMSCVGVMFAPRHDVSARELLRVCRPGGTIGLVSWTPGGFIGQMLATMKPYLAAPPPGAQPAPLWGDESHVRTLLGDGIDDAWARTETVHVDCFATGAEFRDYFKTNYGPTIVAYRGLADHPDRAAQLDSDLAQLADRHLSSSGAMEWEYLIFCARRR
jgi:SAM-dependent methyltransferase